MDSPFPFPHSQTSTTGEAAKEQEQEKKQQDNEKSEEKESEEEQVEEELKEGYEPKPTIAPKDFEKGPWTDPSNVQYGQGKCHQALFRMVKSLSNTSTDLENIEAAFITLTDNEPSNYKEVMHSHNADW